MDKIIAFILYFVVVLAIGIYFFFKSKGGDEKEYESNNLVHNILLWGLITPVL